MTMLSVRSRQYEQGRLQKARNVPILTILTEPLLPVKKSYRPRRLFVVLGRITSASLQRQSAIVRVLVGPA